MITQDELKHTFNYQDDKLLWKVKPKSGSVSVGDIAGTLTENGYMRVVFNRTPHFIHRFIWIYHNGDIPKNLFIDHINGIRDDNRIDNLRLVTKQENSFNTKAKGYTWSKAHNKWRSKIRVNGKHVHLGMFEDEIDARKAYLDAKKEYHTICQH